MRPGIQVESKRDLNLLVGYLSLQLDLAELTLSPRGSHWRMCTGMPPQRWAQPQLGFLDKKCSDPTRLIPGSSP